MDYAAMNAKQLRDIVLRLERLQADVTRLSGRKLPDRFVPLQEATRYLSCGRDWLMAQIREGVLRDGIDFVDRSSSASTRKRFLVNPVSAQRWLSGADPAPVRSKVMTIEAAEAAVNESCSS
jgi:hypothetical protein